MESVNQVQILDKDVYNPLCPNAFGKAMNPFVILSVMDK